jgi:hypothetical protein
MANYRVKLIKEGVSDLQKIVNRGSHSPQTCRAAFILLNVDEGEFSTGKHTNAEICRILRSCFEF